MHFVSYGFHVFFSCSLTRTALLLCITCFSHDRVKAPLFNQEFCYLRSILVKLVCAMRRLANQHEPRIRWDPFNNRKQISCTREGMTPDRPRHVRPRHFPFTELNNGLRCCVRNSFGPLLATRLCLVRSMPENRYLKEDSENDAAWSPRTSPR